MEHAGILLAIAVVWFVLPFPELNLLMIGVYACRFDFSATIEVEITNRTTQLFCPIELIDLLRIGLRIGFQDLLSITHARQKCLTEMLFSIDEDVWGVALTDAGNFDLISPGVTVEPMRILLDTRMFAPGVRNPITIHRQTLRMELIAKDERGMTSEAFSGLFQTSKFIPVRRL